MLAAVSRRGVPVNAILFPGALTGLCVLLNFVMPKGLIELLMSLIVAALLIVWSIIIVTNLKFRRKRSKDGQSIFKAPLSPLSNYLSLLFIVFVVVVM